MAKIGLNKLAAISLFSSFIGLLGSMMFEYVINVIYSGIFISSNSDLSSESG